MATKAIKHTRDVSSEADEESSSDLDASESSPESRGSPDRKSRKAKRKTKKPHIIVNVLNTEYEVVKEVVKDFEYKLSMDIEGDWDLFWANTGVTNDMLCRMKKYQKINHYPSMSCLARKNNLGKNLMRMRREFPGEYGFFPATWLLPFEWKEFKGQFAEKKCKTFIVKPEALSQGKGIFLTRSWESINPIEHYVVQRYIHKPYLIDGLKFDLRIYVLVYGCDPLRIYIYKEGLARLATEPYVPPASNNLRDLFMHLTNYAINKNSDNFVFNTDAEHAEVGHKRSLTFVWEYVDAHGGDSKALRKSIEESIVKTVCAVQPELADSYKTYQANDCRNDKCFEILGFDVLLDHKLKPWLLEVNHSPSFTTDTPFDQKTKFELLTDTFRLLNMNPEKRLKFCKQKEIESQNRRFGKTKGVAIHKVTKEEHDEKLKHHMEKRDKYELANCGGYTRIYPDAENPAKYSEFIGSAQKFWDETVVSKRKPKKEPPTKKSAPPPPPPPPPPKRPVPVQRVTPSQPRHSVPAGNKTAVMRKTLAGSGRQTIEPVEKSGGESLKSYRGPSCKAGTQKLMSPQQSPPAHRLSNKYYHSVNAEDTTTTNNAGPRNKTEDGNVYLPLIAKLPPSFQKMRSKEALEQPVPTYSTAETAGDIAWEKTGPRPAKTKPQTVVSHQPTMGTRMTQGKQMASRPHVREANIFVFNNFINVRLPPGADMLAKFGTRRNQNAIANGNNAGVGTYIVPKVLEFIPRGGLAPHSIPSPSPNKDNNKLGQREVQMSRYSR